jgi:ubiquinone biosynthesis protein
MALGIAALFRLASAGFVLAREGAFSLVDIDDVPPPARLGVRIGRLLSAAPPLSPIAASASPRR